MTSWAPRRGADALLRRFGEVLGGVVTRPYHAARIGGDEFAILMPGADKKAVLALVEGDQRAAAHQQPVLFQRPAERRHRLGDKPGRRKHGRSGQAGGHGNVRGQARPPTMGGSIGPERRDVSAALTRQKAAESTVTPRPARKFAPPASVIRKRLAALARQIAHPENITPALRYRNPRRAQSSRLNTWDALMHWS